MHGRVTLKFMHVLIQCHRVQQLFYCPEGFAARVIDTATNVELNEGDLTSPVNLIDLDSLSAALNTTVAILCKEIRKS
jgi:hypothetical protein